MAWRSSPCSFTACELKPTTDYFMRAVEVVKENKQLYEAAQGQALLQP